MNAVRVLEQETAKGIDTLAAKTQEVMKQESRLPGGQAQELAAMTEPEEYMVRRPLSELEHRAAQWMLEEFKARNQVAYERYASLTKQEQGIMDRWQALEYRLNPPAAPVTGDQNGKLSGRNDPYGIIDTRQPVGYDKGKEGGGNEPSQAGRGWGQPNRTNPGRPNAYAEYLAYKQKVQARQQSLALGQALQQLLVQEQAARAVAGPRAFAYNGADGFASSGYETGGAAGAGSSGGTGGTGSSGGIDGGYEAGDLAGTGGLDGGVGADSAFPAAGINETIDQVLSEGGSGTLNTLTDAQKSRLNTLDNTIKDHLTDGDFSGTLRDLQGNPVPNDKGGFFDHLGEMKDSYKSLQKIKRGLEGSLKNPNLSDIDKTLLQEGLDKANSFITKIEKMFEPFGGI